MVMLPWRTAHWLSICLVEVTGATAALSQINEQNSQNYCSSLPLPQLRQSKLSMASISKGRTMSCWGCLATISPATSS